MPFTREVRHRNPHPAAHWRMHRAQPLILVVHSDPWVWAVLSHALTLAGWATKRASNGASGLRLALDLRPDLILVGHELPELLPHDMIELLQADARTGRIPVLALGARGGLDSRDRLHAEVPHDGSATARGQRQTAAAHHRSG
jgi:CheY-like chemotaxis protein